MPLLNTDYVLFAFSIYNDLIVIQFLIKVLDTLKLKNFHFSNCLKSKPK